MNNQEHNAKLFEALELVERFTNIQVDRQKGLIVTNGTLSSAIQQKVLWLKSQGYKIRRSK